LSIEPRPMRTQSRSWRPSEAIDLANDAQVGAWAARLCVTPGELREMIEEMGDRAAVVATEPSVPAQTLGEQACHDMPRVGAPK